MVAAAAPSKAHDDLDSWLTRNEAADMLGVSPATIIDWQRRGHLHPNKRINLGRGPREVLIYNPRELAAIPRRARELAATDPGELAARAFECFEEGLPMRHLVMRLRQTPDAVDKMYKQWLRAGGVEVVMTNAHRAELERHLGAFETMDDLVDRVAELIPERDEPDARVRALESVAPSPGT